MNFNTDIEVCFYCDEFLTDNSEMFCSQECSESYWAENPTDDEEYFNHVNDRQAFLNPVVEN